MKCMFTWANSDVFILIEIIETDDTTLNETNRLIYFSSKWMMFAYGIFHFTMHVLIFSIAFLTECVTSKTSHEHCTLTYRSELLLIGSLTAKDNNRNINLNRVLSSQCQIWAMKPYSVWMLMYYPSHFSIISVNNIDDDCTNNMICSLEWNIGWSSSS
jgi:hypothetical protein